MVVPQVIPLGAMSIGSTAARAPEPPGKKYVIITKSGSFPIGKLPSRGYALLPPAPQNKKAIYRTSS